MIERCSNRVANLAHFLTRNAKRWPDRPAIVWEDQTWSWQEP
jgi:fatty-acyl-CoA synthase